MAPPLIAVVPPEFVVTEAAVTAALKVEVPVLLTVRAPTAVELPTAPLKVTLPPAAETVNALLPFTVPPNVMPGVVLTVTIMYPFAALLSAIVVSVTDVTEIPATTPFDPLLPPSPRHSP